MPYVETAQMGIEKAPRSLGLCPKEKALPQEVIIVFSNCTVKEKLTKVLRGKGQVEDEGKPILFLQDLSVDAFHCRKF